MKIGIIICYFGKWPSYFPYFLSSIAHNKIFHWLLFSDNNYNFPKYDNISYNKIDINEFNRLASDKTNIKIRIEKAYKLCDIRPLFGKIFEDQLRGFDFWGYSDIDIIYGQISDFINYEITENYDIISTYQGFLSGPLCLFRNNNRINELPRQSVNYPFVFESSKHYGFDENIQRKEIRGFSVNKLISLIGFIPGFCISTKANKLTWENLKYQFQWHYKKHTINIENLADMTEVVLNNVTKTGIKAYFNDLMMSDRAFSRFQKHWQLEWIKGILQDRKTGESYLGFHFIDLKNDDNWGINEDYELNKDFTITQKGIY